MLVKPENELKKKNNTPAVDELPETLRLRFVPFQNANSLFSAHLCLQRARDIGRVNNLRGTP